VTSIEIDAQTADAARTALRSTGYGKVTVVTGDGEDGYAPRAPYDRVMATAGARRVPWPWIHQTRPGGRVLVPWVTDYHNGALVSFTVTDDDTATGHIVADTAFMPLHGQRTPRVSTEDCTGRATLTETRLHPYRVLGEYDASLAIGLKVPGCRHIVDTNGSQDDYTVWFIDPWSHAWAALRHEPGADVYPVRQHGPRDLWSEIEAAYRWWDESGRPGASRYGFTVTRAGQRVWLDDPGNAVGRPIT
jgi:hypothetical protein